MAATTLYTKVLRAKTTSNTTADVTLGPLILDFCTNWDDVRVFLDVTNVSGTTPTIDTTIQSSPDSGTTKFNNPGGIAASTTYTQNPLEAAFAQITTVATKAVRRPNIPAQYLYVLLDVGGTNPNYSVGVQVTFPMAGFFAS